MAYPTAVNNQITDSVTQVNTKVLGDAPAVALGNLYQATAQALANAAHNATTSQQQTNITAQAATTMGVTTLYSIDTASDAKGTKTIYGEYYVPAWISQDVAEFFAEILKTNNFLNNKKTETWLFQPQ